MEKQNNEARIKFVRQTARKLLADIGIINPPILLNDIIKHIKKEKDLTVYSWSFGDKTDGIQIIKEDSAIIGYNKKQHPHRQRFTIAHEIGHLFLGHTEKNFILDLNSKKSEEIEANQFAAELLMPITMLKNDIKNGMKTPQLLANRYNVSEEAMWWHVMECKLLKKIY